MAKETTSAPNEANDGRGAKPVAATGRSASTRGGNAARAGSGARSVSRGDADGRQGTTFLSFFDESRAELRKVTWPTREDATNLTVAVIVMTVAIAAFLGIIDGVLDFLVKPLLGS